MAVSLKATRGQAQAAAGHNLIQWDRFKVFTKTEVIALVETYPDTKWKDIPADKIIEIKNRINSLLADEDIPVVKDDVLKWRMTSCIHYYSNKTKTTASGESSSIATANPTAAETQAAGTRPFDPIRDI